MSIQSLRDGSQGILSKILVALIIVVFALFGFGSITTWLTPTPKVATVNGEDVTQQEMEIAVERNRRLMLAQGRSPSEIDEDVLRKDVLENLINRKLLATAAEDLGLYYGDQGIDEEIVSTEAFQVDGVFSPEQFQLVLGSAGYTPMGYRTEMKTDKKLQQLTAGIRQSAFITPGEVRRVNSLAQQVRDVAFLRIEVDSLMDEVSVTEDEVREYYEGHPAEFMTEETVDLSYVELKRENLMDQVEVPEDDLREFFEQTRSVYSREENRRLAHILIEVNDQMSNEEARTRINDIYDRIKSGEDFAALAREFSDDPGSASEGGDLGFSGPGTYVPEFEEVAFDLSLNQLSEPVKTEFGYHLIKLLDVEEARIPEFAEVRDRVEEEYRESQAEEIFVSLSGRLSELAFESPDLLGPAADLDLEVKTTGHVTRNEQEGIASYDEVMQAAYEPDVLVDRNNSRLIEITPNHHVVVRVIEHRPPEVKPFEAVQAQVHETLKREKATALAESRAKEAVAMLEDGSVTRYVADQLGLEWRVVGEVGRNQGALDREINREAFKLPRPPADSKSVGHAVLSGGDAVVISVTNVVNKPRDEMVTADLATFGRVLERQQGTYAFRQYRDQLSADGNVTRSN